MSDPLEARLRPAYEGWSALVSGSAAVALVLTPGFFGLDGWAAGGYSAVLTLHAFWRCRGALRVLRYRRHLRRRRPYVIGSAEIPVSRQRLFLGRGFRWDQRHTQRLMESRKPEHQALLCGVWLWPWRDRSQDMGTDAGGDPAIHGVEPDESPVSMPLADRVGHTLVLGTTRVGKTRLAELLIAQDIRRGEVVIVFDPKGDIGLLRRTYDEACRAGREGEFFLFHLGHPELSARYNPIGSFSRVTEVATRIAGQLPSDGRSAAFREFVWRYVNVMARALVALGRRPDYAQINRHASNIEPLLIDYFEHWLDGEPAAAGWREALAAMEIDRKSLDRALQSRGLRAVMLVEYVRRARLYDPIAHALASTLNYEKSYFDKLVASLLPLLEKLTTGRTAALLSPDFDDVTDWRPVFDWMSVIHLQGIVYVGLDALSDYEVAAAVGNAMFADLTSVAGALYQHGPGAGLPEAYAHPRIAIHADEFNELIGDEFIPLINKAGGAGYQVSAYTQTWSDVEAGIGSPAKAGQVAGNFNSLVMLRVKEMATAELLTDQLPRVQVFNTVASSSVADTNDPGDFADFASRNEDRISVETVPMLAPSDLVQLPKGEAFALLHGGQLYKLRIPLPHSGEGEANRRDLPDIANEIRQRWMGTTIMARDPQPQPASKPDRSE